MESNPKKLLVVDDEPTVLMSVSMLLKSKGFLVAQCSSGQDVLGLLEPDKFDFDCVILDFTLPKMNGMNLLQKIRSAGHQVPVLMFSGLSLDEILTEEFEHHPEETITKPFQFDSLLTKIKLLTGEEN